MHVNRLPIGAFFLAAPFLVPCVPTFAQEPSTNPEPRLDWLRIVPPDVGFYIELNDLESIRRRFRNLGIWRTVRELAEGERFPTTRPARNASEALPGLNSDAAISRVLGKRSALFAISSSRWKNGVVIAELEHPGEVRRLLRQWRKRRLPDDGDIQRYVIGGGIKLAIWNTMLVFGPADDPDGLWDRTVLLLSGKGGPNLRGRSEFASLRIRLPDEPDGLVFVRWPEGDPYALAGCRRLIAGLTFTDSELRCEIHGHRDNANESNAPWDAKFVRALPSNTLAAWSGSVRPSLFKNSATGYTPDNHNSLIEMFFDMLNGLDGKRLGPQVTIVVGPKPTVDAHNMHLPAVTAVVRMEAAEGLVKQLDVVVGSFATMMSASSTQHGKPVEPIEIERNTLGNIELHAVPLGHVLSKRLDLPVLERIELCWAALEDRILMSTSRRHVERILLAKRRAAIRIEGDIRTKGVLPDRQRDGEIVEWTMLNGAELARMLKNWLGYLLKHHPAAFRDRWWQQWAAERLESQSRLGVGLKDDPVNPRRAIVHTIEPDSRAEGILHVGDIIESANGQPLEAGNPARQIAHRYAERGNAPSFDLAVLRDGTRLQLSIPIPPKPDVKVGDLEPIRALRQLIVLLRPVKTLTVSRFGVHPEWYNVEIAVHWIGTTHASD
ncbi:MAG: hypothetical protein ACE5EQ_09900 [Phycisphaerae bacterium]